VPELWARQRVPETNQLGYLLALGTG